MDRVGMRTTSVYKLMREGRFPRGIALGARLVVWQETAIDAWIAEQVQLATSAQPLPPGGKALRSSRVVSVADAAADGAASPSRGSSHARRGEGNSSPIGAVVSGARSY